VSTYLRCGGAERERALAELWADLELRLQQDEPITMRDLRPGLVTRRYGWDEDELSLVFALSGHAYHRVMLAVDRIAAHEPATSAEELAELRAAYGLLQTSRRLADELAY
jgi:hypothetical protein